MDELRSKRQTLNDACQHHKAFLAPIHRLPNEMLSEIFIASIHHLKHKIYKFRRAVILLTTICSHWRNVALLTPKLWSSICLTKFECTVRSDIELARTWLTRSGGLPLSLQLRGHGLAAPLIVDMFSEYAERWEHVDICMSYSLLRHIVSVKNRLPRLRTLRIATGTKPELQLAGPIDTFEIAPHLTSLTIGCFISPRKLVIPWCQLSTIRADLGLSIDNWRYVLHQAPNLVECDLYTTDGDEEIRSSRPTIHLTRLRAIAMQGWGNQGLLFDHLTLPALISFQYIYNGCIWSQAQFVSLLSRSSCSLKILVLSIPGSQSDKVELVECLRLMPSLVYLQLDLILSERDLLSLAFSRSMLPITPAHYLVPKLEFLRLSMHSMRLDEVIADVIESRQIAESHNNPIGLYPLKTVQFDLICRPIFNSSILSRLRDCGRRGLNVRIGNLSTYSSYHELDKMMLQDRH